MSSLLNRVADCIKGGSTFTREDRLEMAGEIVSIVFEGVEIEQAHGSFQSLMDAYVRGYRWAGENPNSEEFLHKAAYDYSDKVTGPPAPEITADEPGDDFHVTLRPTRKGFRLHEDDDRMLRLWVGQSSAGQDFGLLSYGMFCETQLHGFDYTPIDLASLPLFPAGLNERIAAVNAMVDAEKNDSVTLNPSPVVSAK